MADQSHLDRKYFIDEKVYNCPFCNRNHVRYRMTESFVFDWTENKTCRGYLIKCSSCDNTSMHLSFTSIRDRNYCCFRDDIDIDSYIFYSVPTSFFVIDNRIPGVIRELITEAEGCLKMNYLTGASACARKSIYELLIKEKAEGQDYETKIKWLKKKYTSIDPDLFDILAHIQDMTSDKIHEQSWPKWDSGNLKLIIETVKTVLHEIYVLPKIKETRSQRIKNLLAKVKKDHTEKTKGDNVEEATGAELVDSD